ncbi:MAG: triosephosphate isomerase, partial [Alphaproteobacteria bacterium]|nr:triosephosphate isomerase [Alphaproteobacteria bacterium]
MALRSKLIAGNWKMNGLRAPGLALARDIAARAAAGSPACDLLVCPPATLVILVGEAIAGSGIALGGQDCHPKENGACTGDVSAEMLKDAGCSHVILGHSERRSGCGETDATVNAKVAAAWRAGLTAVVCVGETRAEREAGLATAVVSAQLSGSLPAGAT